MGKRGRFGMPESRGPKYYCFLCQGTIDSPIQACPKHEPELHRKLTETRRKREKRPRTDAPEKVESKPPEKKPKAEAPEGEES